MAIDKEANHDKWASEQARIWLDEHEEYIEKYPDIDFDGSIFVFVGVAGDERIAEKEHPIVQEVIAKGGQYRTAVSGKTNYVVANPGYCGTSKVKACIEQMQKRDNIKLILLEDLKKALSEESYYVSETLSQTSAASTPYTTNTEPVAAKVKKSKKSSSADFDIESGVLKRYKGSASKVIVPEGVIEIGECAFFFSKLVEVVLPENLHVIRRSAFSYCNNLKEIVLPDGFREIEGRAFSGCESLININIPLGVKSIGEYAFGFCKNLRKVALPSTLREIEESAFCRCESLTNINIPKGVEQIDEGVFFHCSNVTIHTPRGSKADEYARRNGIPVVYTSDNAAQTAKSVPGTVHAPSPTYKQQTSGNVNSTSSNSFAVSSYSASSMTSNNTYSNNTHVSNVKNDSSQQVPHTDNDGCPLLLKIIGLVFGIAAFIISLPHEEYLDLGIARGTISVETNWVGIILGLIIITVMLITTKKD